MVNRVLLYKQPTACALIEDRSLGTGSVQMDFPLAALVMLNAESEWWDAAVPCRLAALASTPRSTVHKRMVALVKSFIRAQM